MAPKKHLLDETSLEQQFPLTHRQQRSSSGNDEYYDDDDDEEEDYAHTGETVRVRGTSVPVAAACYGIIVDEEFIRLRDEEYDASANDKVVKWVPVWFCNPAFCGDPSQLLRYVPLDDLCIVDRPINLNDTVLHQETGKVGVVCSVNVKFSKTSVMDVLNYHRHHRFSSNQTRFAEALASDANYERNPRKKRRESRFLPWCTALNSNRSLCSTEQIQAVDQQIDGYRFLRANPFFVGQLVRSFDRVADIPSIELFEDPDNSPNDDDDVDGFDDHIHHQDDVVSINDLNVLDSASTASTGTENEKIPFFGHVCSVQYDCLVELFVPNLSDDEPQGPKFLVVIPSGVVSTSGGGEPKVTFRNYNHHLHDDSHEHDSEEDGPSVAPPHVDTICPLMYAEHIALSTLEHEVVWIVGSYSEYITALGAAMQVAASSESRRRHRKVKPGPLRDVDDDNVCGNGIVMFTLPATVTALNFYDGNPMDFSAADIMPMETSGSDSVIVGQFGFVEDVPTPELYADSPPMVQMTSPSTAEDPRNCAIFPSAVAAHQWYVTKGILPERNQQQGGDSPSMDWTSRLAKLQSVMREFGIVTKTSSQVNVVWRETGDGECVNATALRSIDRNEDLPRDLYPLDVVAPSPYYLREKLALVVAALDNNDTTTETSAIPLLVDEECALLDTTLTSDYDTELQVSESVRPRLYRKSEFIHGDDDPEILGFIERVNVADQTCSIQWYRQPRRYLRGGEEVVTHRPDDVGQIVELLTNTLVRVMWSDGCVEDLPRSQLVTVRDVEDGDDDGAEEEEWATDEEDSDAENAQPTTPATSSNGFSLSGTLAGGISRSLDAIQRGFERLVVGALQPRHPSSAVVGEEDVPPPPPSMTPPAEEATTTTTVPTVVVHRSLLEHVSMFTKHHFGPEPVVPRNSSIFMKRIQREWSDTANRLSALPTAATPIYVKACREMPCFLKFALVGPMHSPYYQSFLAFDLVFGDDFPISPPKVFFHAYHERLNPNLYENGHICLSLLGTWDGDSSEHWNPATSSLSQILLSLQSLVLVKEPYYNEAGYEEQRGTLSGRRASKAYNENLALLRLKHMMAMADRPPHDWVFAFRQHFLAVAPSIHRRLSDLLDAQEKRNARDGGISEDDKGEYDDESASSGGITADGLVLPLTKGFVLSMHRCLAAFADCIERHRKEWEAEEAGMHDSL